MGVVHQQPLGKLYCFILKIPLYLRFFWEIFTYPNSFLGHNLSRFTCLGNDPRKPTSGRKTPEIHAAPRLPDVLTALRRPFFGKSWETRGPSTQKYRLSNTFFGVWKGMLRNISKSWKWKKKAKHFWLTPCWFFDWRARYDFKIRRRVEIFFRGNYKSVAVVCSPAALADSSKEVGIFLGDLPVDPMKGATS